MVHMLNLCFISMSIKIECMQSAWHSDDSGAVLWISNKFVFLNGWKKDHFSFKSKENIIQKPLKPLRPFRI